MFNDNNARNPSGSGRLYLLVTLACAYALASFVSPVHAAPAPRSNFRAPNARNAAVITPNPGSPTPSVSPSTTPAKSVSSSTSTSLSRTITRSGSISRSTTKSTSVSRSNSRSLTASRSGSRSASASRSLSASPSISKSSSPTPLQVSSTPSPSFSEATTASTSASLSVSVSQADTSSASASSTPARSVSASLSASPTVTITAVSASTSPTPTPASASTNPTAVSASTTPTPASASTTPTAVSASASPTPASASTTPIPTRASASTSPTPTPPSASTSPTPASSTTPTPTRASASTTPTPVSSSTTPTPVSSSTTPNAASASTTPTAVSASASPTPASASASPSHTCASASVPPTRSPVVYGKVLNYLHSRGEALNITVASPLRVVYTDSRDVNETAPQESILQMVRGGFNVVIIAFYLTTGPTDVLAMWASVPLKTRVATMAAVHAQGAVVLLSAGGATESPYALSPTAYGSAAAALAISLNLDGVDFDMENLDTGCVFVTGAAPMTASGVVSWLVSATLAARAALGQGIITHAPQAPYFGAVGSNAYWAGPTGCYSAVYAQLAKANALSWFNLQFYNQGVECYVTFANLFQTSDSCPDFPGTSVVEIMSYGIPLSAVVVGKPMLPEDAGNGYITAAMLRSFLVQASAVGLSPAGVMIWEWSASTSPSWISTVYP